MVEKYLGDEQAGDIFVSSMLATLVAEKQAMEKDAQDGNSKLSGFLKALANGSKFFRNTLGMGWDLGKGSLSSLGWIAALGGGAGVLGSTAYDVIKERVTHEDPEAKMNEEIESIYNNKAREAKDSRWMARVRGMRDELKRGYKKMDPDEYAKKYNDLVKALGERKAIS